MRMQASSEIPVEVQEQLNVNYYLSLIAFTLLYYDYFLTFHWEVERCWKYPSFTWGSVLFYLNRYLNLVGSVPVVMEYFWVSEANERKANICLHLQIYHQYFAIAVQVLVAVMLILRTYALYERNRKILAVMLVVAVAALIVAIWTIVVGRHERMVEEFVPRIRCATTLTDSSSKRLAIAWSGMLVIDSLILVLTLYKALTLRRGGRVSLLPILLRDGTVYFGVISASNLANILIFIRGGGHTRGVGVTLTNAMSSIMISRLVLNLRDPKLAKTPARVAGNSRTVNLDPLISTLQPTFDSEVSEAEYDDEGHNSYILRELRPGVGSRGEWKGVCRGCGHGHGGFQDDLNEVFIGRNKREEERDVLPLTFAPMNQAYRH